MTRLLAVCLRAGTIFAVPLVVHVSSAFAQTGTITGIVTDSQTGAPINGAWVVIYRDNDKGRQATWHATANTYTAADGSYSAVVAPGAYWIEISIVDPNASAYSDDDTSHYSQVVGQPLGSDTPDNPPPAVVVADGAQVTENVRMKPTTLFNSSLTFTAKWEGAKIPPRIGAKITGYTEASYDLVYSVDSGVRHGVKWAYEIMDAHGQIVARSTKPLASGVSGFATGGYPSDFCGFYSDSAGTEVGKNKVVHYHFDFATMTAKLWPVGFPTQALTRRVKLSADACRPILRWGPTSAGAIVEVVSNRRGGYGLAGRAVITVDGKQVLAKTLHYKSAPGVFDSDPMYQATDDEITLPKQLLHRRSNSVVVTYAPFQHGVATPPPLAFKLSGPK